MSTSMDILGDLAARELGSAAVIGDAGSFDPSALIDLASGLAKSGAKYGLDKQAKAKADAEAIVKAQAAIAADAAATAATSDYRKALLDSTDAGKARAEAVKIVMDQTLSAEDEAGVGLSDDAQTKRLAAARTAANDAARKSADAATAAARSPKDVGKRTAAQFAKIDAACAQETVDRIARRSTPAAQAEAAKEVPNEKRGGGGFLDKMNASTALWVGGGVVMTGGVIALIVMLIRKMRKRAA